MQLPTMSVDKAFEGAGAKPGVEVWRIEKLAPVPVPPKMYGMVRSLC